MTSYRLFKYLRMFLAFGLFVVLGSLAIVGETIGLILQENRFHRLYGSDWVQVYEKYEEPLSQTNFKIGLGIAYVLVMFGFGAWLYRRFALKNSRRSRRRY